MLKSGTKNAKQTGAKRKAGKLSGSSEDSLGLLSGTLFLWVMASRYTCICVCVYNSMAMYILKNECSNNLQYVAIDSAPKADCLWVGRNILEAMGKSLSTTFVQREKRNFQTAQNGVLPSVAIFAGQLKRNQLQTKKKKTQ